MSDQPTSNTVIEALRLVPAYYRYRHSAGEKWHYGTSPKNWWECQTLYAFAETQGLVAEAESTEAHLAMRVSEVMPFVEWLAMVSQDDWAAFQRFYECLSDGEGYDVPAERMERLADLGLLRKVRGTVYEFTQLGLAMQSHPAANSQQGGTLGELAVAAESGELDTILDRHGVPPLSADDGQPVRRRNWSELKEFDRSTFDYETYRRELDK